MEKQKGSKSDNNLYSVNELVDIENFEFTAGTDKEERITEFLEKTGNPYIFKCGEITVRIKYAENGPSFEECFKEYMDSLDI